MPRIYVRVDALERVLSRLAINGNGCWLFQGVSRSDGYGAVALGGKGSAKILAHRLTFDRLVGKIPHGYELHHRCEVRACCNPDHLVLVTRTDHMRQHAPSTCLRGHADWRTRPNGQRDCRVCHRERERERARRLRLHA